MTISSTSTSLNALHQQLGLATPLRKYTIAVAVLYGKCLSWRPTRLQTDSLARRRERYDLIRAIEDRASLAFARIASALAFRKSRNVRNTTEGSPSCHATIRSRYRSGSSRTNCTPFDRRLLVEAGTMATPSSASTNERIVCIEFGSFSTRGEKPCDRHAPTMVSKTAGAPFR